MEQRRVHRLAGSRRFRASRDSLPSIDLSTTDAQVIVLETTTPSVLFPVSSDGQPTRRSATAGKADRNGRSRSNQTSTSWRDRGHQVSGIGLVEADVDINLLASGHDHRQRPGERLASTIEIDLDRIDMLLARRDSRSDETAPRPAHAPFAGPEDRPELPPAHSRSGRRPESRWPDWRPVPPERPHNPPTHRSNRSSPMTRRSNPPSRRSNRSSPMTRHLSRRSSPRNPMIRHLSRRSSPRNPMIRHSIHSSRRSSPRTRPRPS